MSDAMPNDLNQPKDLSTTPIDEMGLERRLYHSLRRAGFETIGSVADLTAKELKGVKNVGIVHVNTVRCILYLEYGVFLKGENESIVVPLLEEFLDSQDDVVDTSEESIVNRVAEALADSDDIRAIAGIYSHPLAVNTFIKAGITTISQLANYEFGKIKRFTTPKFFRVLRAAMAFKEVKFIDEIEG